RLGVLLRRPAPEAGRRRGGADDGLGPRRVQDQSAGHERGRVHRLPAVRLRHPQRRGPLGRGAVALRRVPGGRRQVAAGPALGRSAITKTDLLCAQAVGYKLRDTSAFTPLALTTAELPAGRVGAAYSAGLRAAGGIPFYDWTVTAGALPPGLALDPFTGAVTG